jgi:hypothetical protein
MKMADSPYNIVATAPDAVSMRVENALKIVLESCQSASQATDASGKNATYKANLTLMNNALNAWGAYLGPLIASL